MKGLYQRRNSKSSNSASDTAKQVQFDETKKLQSIHQVNEQLQKIRQSHQQINSSRSQQPTDNPSTNKINYQEYPQEYNQINSPYSQQNQSTISPIQLPPSNQHSFKSLPHQGATPSSQIESKMKLIYLRMLKQKMQQELKEQQIKEHQMKEIKQQITDYMKSNQILIERNAILENDLLLQRNQNNLLMHSNSHSNGLNSLNNTNNTVNSLNNVDRQLQAALIDKLRLEEIIDFMKEESEKLLEELNIFKSKSELLEKDLKNTSHTMFQNQNQVQAFYSQNKKIEDQLKLSNIHFVNAQKKLSAFEKENKELNEKLSFVEQEKKKISQKWHAASQNRKQEEKLKQRIKELEIELNDKSVECDEFKKKYASTNTELRVYKEGEFNYKDIVENKFKEIKEKWHEEMKQKEELLKQNNELLSQLEQFSNEFQNLQHKYEKQTIEKESIQSMNSQLKQQKEQLQAVSMKQENIKEMNATVQFTREELTKRLQQANHEINNLIKSNEDSNLQILVLQQDKHIMNKQIEDFLKQNEQLQDALNSLLNENQQEQELLSHITSNNNIHGSGSKMNSNNISIANINGQAGQDKGKNKSQQQQQQENEQQEKEINDQQDKEIDIFQNVISQSEEYQILIENVHLINEETLVNEIQLKLDDLILFISQYITSSQLTQDCEPKNNQNSQITQKGFEKSYYEVKNMYDRLLVKHYNLQKKNQQLEEIAKSKQGVVANLNSSFQITKNFVNHISPQDGSFEDLQDQQTNGSAHKTVKNQRNQQRQIDRLNDSFESMKQIKQANALNQKVEQTYSEQMQSKSDLTNQYQSLQPQLQFESQKEQLHTTSHYLSNSQAFTHNNNNNKSYNFASTLNSTNTNLIQNILRNDFHIKEQLSDNSQKMLNTILNKFLTTQGLNNSILNQSNRNIKSQGTVNQTLSANRLINSNGQKNNNSITDQSTSGRVAGPPTRTLERSLLRRNKSKENYQLNNSSSNLIGSNTPQQTHSNNLLNQSLDTYQRKYLDQHNYLSHLSNYNSNNTNQSESFKINQNQSLKSNHNTNSNITNTNNNNSAGSYINYLKQRKNSNSHNEINSTPANGGGYSSIHQMNRSFDGYQQQQQQHSASGQKPNSQSQGKYIKKKGQFSNNNNNNNNNNMSNGKNKNMIINQQPFFDQQKLQYQKINDQKQLNQQNYKF